MSVFKRCLSLIADGKTEKAFFELERENLSSAQRSELTSIRYRYKKLESENNRKFLTKDEYYTGHAKITHDFIELINGFEAAQLKKANNRSRSNWLRFAAPVLAAILAIGSYFYFSKPDKESINVIFLRFLPNKDCINEKVEYEKLFVERYQNISNQDNLNILPEFIDQEVKNEAEAEALGKDRKADLVIWGAFTEDCDQENYEIEINYSITSEINQLCLMKKSGKTNLEKNGSVLQFRDQEVYENIDRIVYLLSATSKYLKKGELDQRIKDAKEILSKYIDRKKSCDDDYLTSVFICFLSAISSDLNQNINPKNKYESDQIFSLFEIVVKYLNSCPDSSFGITVLKQFAISFFYPGKRNNEGIAFLYYFGTKELLNRIRNPANNGMIDEAIAELDTKYQEYEAKKEEFKIKFNE